MHSVMIAAGCLADDVAPRPQVLSQHRILPITTLLDDIGRCLKTHCVSTLSKELAHQKLRASPSYRNEDCVQGSLKALQAGPNH